MFHISGMVRSGTNWLGKVLNDSCDEWLVDREVFTKDIMEKAPFGKLGGFEQGDIYYSFKTDTVSRRFRKASDNYMSTVSAFFSNRKGKHYGKVSPQFGFILDKLISRDGLLDKVGMLVRHPHHILLSCANRDNAFVYSKARRWTYLQNVCNCANLFLKLVGEGVPLFKYEEITKQDGFGHLVRHLGLTSVCDFSKVDFKTKVNSYQEHNQDNVYTSLVEIMPQKELVIVKKSLQKFIDIVYGD